MRHTRTLLVVGVMVVTLFGACAKRPALTAASSPPPTGAAQVQPAPTPPPAPPPAAAQPAPAPPPPAAAAPEPARPAPKEFVAVEALRPVFFDFDRYEIRPADRKVLDANAQWLKENANQILLIEGHCDERGTNEYNLGLGERRARATMNYLVNQGVAANRISLVSYGEERPACTERTERCWQQNRRAAFLVKER